MPNIVIVVPTIRPDSLAKFRAAWAPDFDKYRVTLVTVWDGDAPAIEWDGPGGKGRIDDAPNHDLFKSHRDLFCRKTDGVRNLGLALAATMDPDLIGTMDDDILPRVPWPANCGTRDGNFGDRDNPVYSRDPIGDHLRVLNRRVPLGWMNTAMGDSPYLRGVPYGIRQQSPVMASHGVWDGTPDFDGQTQLHLMSRIARCPNCRGEGTIRHERDSASGYTCGTCEGTGKLSGRVPTVLPYYAGHVPRGVQLPFCGMNVMVRRDALKYLYFAPMGADSGFPNLHRFADIFMGRLLLKPKFDELGWAVYTGASTVYHSRASDPFKNEVQERMGRAWLEDIESGTPSPECERYVREYAEKSERYAALVDSLLVK